MKFAINIISWVIGSYCAFMLIWFMLMTACIQDGYECGGDAMTHAVQTIHTPIINLFK